MSALEKSEMSFKGLLNNINGSINKKQYLMACPSASIYALNKCITYWSDAAKVEEDKNISPLIEKICDIKNPLTVYRYFYYKFCLVSYYAIYTVCCHPTFENNIDCTLLRRKLYTADLFLTKEYRFRSITHCV